MKVVEFGTGWKAQPARKKYLTKAKKRLIHFIRQANDLHFAGTTKTTHLGLFRMLSKWWARVANDTQGFQRVPYFPQFRALSDQFYRTPEHHKFVRQQVVNQLKSCPVIYEGYVPMAYGDYLKKMSKSGEWGDHVTLQAAADSYGVKIFVITSFKDTCYMEIIPNVQRSKRVIFLSFWAEVHYNSIYPEGDMPAVETKKKKKWWAFQDKHVESPDEYIFFDRQSPDRYN
ncbi:hypothetical protein U1Q18_032998 [Sarracenia purpurea var. burkii]